MALCVALNALAFTAFAQQDTHSLLLGLRELCAGAAKLNVFTLKATCQYGVVDYFAKYNPGDYEKATETYSVEVQQDRFTINVSFSPTKAAPFLAVSTTYDGHNTSYYRGDIGLTSVKSGLKLEPDNSSSLGSILFLPFSFLVESEEVGKFPIVTPPILADDAVWSALEKKASILPSQSTRNTICLKVAENNGTYYLVWLNMLRGGFPEVCEIFSENDRLLRSFRCTSLESIAFPGGNVTFARQASVMRYLKGMPFAEHKLSITEIDSLSTKDMAADKESARYVFKGRHEVTRQVQP